MLLGCLCENEHGERNSLLRFAHSIVPEEKWGTTSSLSFSWLLHQCKDLHQFQLTLSKSLEKSYSDLKICSFWLEISVILNNEVKEDKIKHSREKNKIIRKKGNGLVNFKGAHPHGHYCHFSFEQPDMPHGGQSRFIQKKNTVGVKLFCGNAPSQGQGKTVFAWRSSENDQSTPSHFNPTANIQRKEKKKIGQRAIWQFSRYWMVHRWPKLTLRGKGVM